MSLKTSYDERLKNLALATRRYKLLEETERLEANFTGFVEDAWPSIDSTPFMRNWAVDGICEHLQAVTEGHIKRLLINIPFRSGKSAVTTSVCWPAWTWTWTWTHLVDAR
jgi:hypothetical protein